MLFLLLNNGFRNPSLPTSLTYGLGTSSSPIWRDAEGPLKHGVLVWGWVLVLFKQPQGFESNLHALQNNPVCLCLQLCKNVSEDIGM